jgi:zinc protease
MAVMGRDSVRRFAAAACLAAGLAGCAAVDGGPEAGAAPPQPALAAASPPPALPLDDLRLELPYTRFVLRNGLTLIVHEDRSAPIVTVHLWYHVGSKNEPPGRSGFAHLFEHLMFNGSENFNDDFFKATQKIGATSQNGTTNYDRTNYFQNVPKEALDSILWLESDRMGYLLGAVDQAKLNEQRGVVQNEKRQGENQPYGLVNERIIAATYPKGHPYGHSVIGSMEDLNAASLNDVREWFRTWYGPSNAVLVLSGDVNPEEARAKVEAYFGAIPPGPPVSKPKAWVPKLTTPQREEMFDRVAAPRIYRVWNVPELGHPDGEPLDAIAYALAGDKNARLTRRLVHVEQVATSVAAANGQNEIAGQFRIVVTAKPDADLAYIEKAIDEELAALLAEGPSPGELERVKVQTVADLVRQLERTSSKASLLATWETFIGDPDGWKASLERLKAVTAANAATVAARWLDEGSYTLVVRPFPDFAASGKPVDRSAMPAPGAIADAQFPDFRTARLSNGLRVLHVKRDGAPMVNMRLIVDTGYGEGDAGDPPGLGPLAMSLLDEGAGRRSGLEIADELDRLGASLFVSGGGETTSVDLSTLTIALDPALDIFADVIRRPSFNVADFDRLRQQQAQSLRQSEREPNAIASRVMARRLWGDTHPYGRLATPETLEAVTLEGAKAFHQRWFGPNNAVLLVVGEVGLEEILPKIESRFADWAPATAQRTAPTRPARPRAPEVLLIDRPGALQSVILVGSTQGPRDPESEFALSAFNAMFGGNFTSRVNMNLREDKGWSYGARSSLGGGRGPRSFVVSAPVQTDATRGALEELRKELTGVVGGRPPSAEELETVQTNAILGLSGRWENAAAVVDTLADIALFDLPPDFYDRFAAGIRGVDLDAVRSAARSLIPDQNHLWVIVGDREKIEADVRALNIGAVTVVGPNGDPLP